MHIFNICIESYFHNIKSIMYLYKIIQVASGKVSYTKLRLVEHVVDGGLVFGCGGCWLGQRRVVVAVS